MLTTVAHACNLSNLGRGKWEYHSMRPAQEKSCWDLIATNKLDMVDVSVILITQEAN
jgi:hypothetical protein